MKPAARVVLVGATCLALPAVADEERSAAEARAAVEWVEEADAQCVMQDGVLIGVRNRDRQRPLRVWIERWYLDVRTADRGRHDLPPDGAITPLGCSETRQGAQRWTLHDARFVAPDSR
ncbi:hypothetical protein [Methyloversatilis sp.]|uniref:hypothetical protein n=1 Tax=Methyloversatilis sp. TaxID=2569862 RepID=UPI003F6E9BE7